MLKLPTSPEMESLSRAFIETMQDYTSHGIDRDAFVAAFLPALIDHRHAKEAIICLELQWFMAMIQVTRPSMSHFAC
jgi:hypothetical protein